MTHKCFKAADKALALKNTRLSFALSLDKGDDYLIIATDKLDDAKRGKQVRVLATHCPFCGKEYRK